ncbi:hypothetical protein Tco_0953977 [Tanacetum coccineum]|uniref:Uncharacterized protein n=1 Tax=Tanacetum coccineum TaxID=301880 RepID=A0ABQ5E241_9ASTR
MASMNTRLNIEKLDGNIVQKHGGSKQVGFKQLGSSVETEVYEVHDEKRVWFEVELKGAHGDRKAEGYISRMGGGRVGEELAWADVVRLGARDGYSAMVSLGGMLSSEDDTHHDYEPVETLFTNCTLLISQEGVEIINRLTRKVSLVAIARYSASISIELTDGTMRRRASVLCSTENVAHQELIGMELSHIALLWHFSSGRSSH